MKSAQLSNEDTRQSWVPLIDSLRLLKTLCAYAFFSYSNKLHNRRKLLWTWRSFSDIRDGCFSNLIRIQGVNCFAHSESRYAFCPTRHTTSEHCLAILDEPRVTEEHVCHQTEHLLMGFIGEPRGQLNTSAKSSELDNVPITRNFPGECTAVFNLFLVASGLIAPHQTWAKFRKKSCFPVAFNPGRVSSASPFNPSHLS